MSSCIHIGFPSTVSEHVSPKDQSGKYDREQAENNRNIHSNGKVPSDHCMCLRTESQDFHIDGTQRGKEVRSNPALLPCSSLSSQRHQHITTVVVARDCLVVHGVGGRKKNEMFLNCTKFLKYSEFCAAWTNAATHISFCCASCLVLSNPLCCSQSSSQTDKVPPSHSPLRLTLRMHQHSTF